MTHKRSVTFKRNILKPAESRKQYLSKDRTHIRELQIDAKIDESSRSVELSFSSANGIKQYDFWHDEWYSEVLEHSERAVILTRLTEIGVGLFNHDSDKVVGRLSDVRLEEKTGKCYCRLTFDMDEFADTVYEKVRSGTLKGVSVGFRVYKWEEIKTGKTSRDGIKGPARIARKWEPIEVSIVSCPADPSVGVGRSIVGEEYKERGVVNFKKQVQEALRKLHSGDFTREQFDAELRGILAGVDPEEMDEAARFISDVRSATGEEDDKKEPSEEDKKKNSEDDEDAKEEKSEDEEKKEENKAKRGLADERKRSSEISAVCARFGVSPSDTARFISNGTPLVDVYRAVTERSAQADGNGLPIGRSVVERGEDERDKYRRAVTDGMRMRTGAVFENPAPGANEFRHLSLLELARDVLERHGEHGARRLPAMETAARAFSTSDFPAIMSNLANVTLQAAYTEVPSTWRGWCRVGSANDFKAQHRVRMGELPELEPVLEAGEYKMADMLETKDSFSIGTFGKKFALTRQAIINDDLGAFTRIPQLFGTASSRTINRAVYKLLKSNPKIAEDGKPVFHADHNNLGEASALSIGAFDAARIAMRRQTGLRKDKDKITMNITPSFLLLPPELETLAMQILYSDTDLRYANANVKNPFRNAFTPIVEAELEAWEWFLVAAPSMIDTIEVAFLGGMQSPTLEQQQGWNVDGIEYKVRLDFGVWLYEHRGLYKNPGAEPEEKP